MNRLTIAVTAAALFCCAAAPGAQARDHFSFGVGFGGCCGYYPGYYYNPYWAPPAYYYEPAPSVVYETAPQTIYVQPQPQTVYTQPAPAVSAAASTSPIYTDAKGRTCRAFDATMNDGTPVKGTACLQPDGTWHTVK